MAYFLGAWSHQHDVLSHSLLAINKVESYSPSFIFHWAGFPQLQIHTTWGASQGAEAGLYWSELSNTSTAAAIQRSRGKLSVLKWLQKTFATFKRIFSCCSFFSQKCYWNKNKRCGDKVRIWFGGLRKIMLFVFTGVTVRGKEHPEDEIVTDDWLIAKVALHLYRFGAFYNTAGCRVGNIYKT